MVPYVCVSGFYCIIKNSDVLVSTDVHHMRVIFDDCVQYKYELNQLLLLHIIVMKLRN